MFNAIHKFFTIIGLLIWCIFKIIKEIPNLIKSFLKAIDDIAEESRLHSEMSARKREDLLEEGYMEYLKAIKKEPNNLKNILRYSNISEEDMQEYIYKRVKGDNMNLVKFTSNKNGVSN